MGIQINGVNDIISATDGSFSLPGADLTNLSQVNVTGVGTFANLVVTGNVSIAGTLTYEDVTNVDSIGIITARTGIQVLAGGINATGIITATSFSGDVTGNVTGNLTGTASTATAAATAYGLSGSPTLSGITSVSTTNLTVNGNAYPSAGPLSNRNLVINGSMVVNQRGFTGAAGTTTDSAYTTDRFLIVQSHDGAVSAGQTSMNSTTGGNAYADGFQNALFFNVTTADTSLAAGQYQLIQHRIEGYNVQGIKKGTVNAQPVTLSFWCRSTTTGTYIAELIDIDNGRFCSQAYIINVANTWEKKVLTFPADTTGVFNNDNASSLEVYWWFAAGSNFSGGTLATTWHTTSANRVVGQTNLLASAGNNFWLTGVQLEVGTVATPFEHRSYSDEEMRCRRYYQQFGGNSANERIGNSFNFLSSQARIDIPLIPPMRTSPTLAVSDVTHFSIEHQNGSTASTNLALDQASPRIAAINISCSSGLTAGQGSHVIANSNINARLKLSAEL